MTHFVDGPLILIPLKDYELLIGLVGHDDMFLICGTCGAWLHREDPATCSVDEFEGCWKMATGRERDSHLCRSYRSTVREISKT